ncbi:thymidine kinase [Porphyromonas gingivalis]|uniref:Thymidine kinase n=1 Tax=Porphyromonas gingivalis (strain ATCC 33277 / DSM 20709 / CIP 103683 / JCM 12257 / NCTC 11834 / 2561) TaxID=431947 RepID=KITH_PORG3|nr:thymidine kinase [Porphyromonas gingivalis]B2RJJ6.1 RecName: Full=Thymidine kinase [Porphyromonas gingivalis ATCC 33277]AIJ35811.1 thymidine kinase [Porphyromonas gingivalis]ALJ25454.1 thymidine kinase [Porphyromonas gingivalis 381]AUR50264.1 thymidine kinase [Porphyromonas gingivalis ATCC 33277]MDR4976723.1 thymidine kinase [Porphyromonas gingivalis]SJL19317.1 thymidine kinase [Porphyromonas gingivalis]
MDYEIENNHADSIRRGSIEVICGSMFSGKTEELLRRLRRAKIARQTVEIFKPTIDIRYDETDVVSHDKNAIASAPVDNSANILLLSSQVDVVGIDEAQFFDEGLVEVAQQLADQGVRVVIAGLDMDFRRQPFGPMPGLCAIADSVTKVHAVCVECGRLASYSFRRVQGDQQVMLGELNEYSPLCRTCYRKCSSPPQTEEIHSTI